MGTLLYTNVLEVASMNIKSCLLLLYIYIYLYEPHNSSVDVNLVDEWKKEYVPIGVCAKEHSFSAIRLFWLIDLRTWSSVIRDSGNNFTIEIRPK